MVKRKNIYVHKQLCLGILIQMCRKLVHAKKDNEIEQSNLMYKVGVFIPYNAMEIELLSSKKIQ